MKTAIFITAFTTMTLASALAGPPPSCTVSAGPTASAKYVSQCLMVSTGTHPPCNANNPCYMIINEIKRGCALFDRNAADLPQFCRSFDPAPH